MMNSPRWRPTRDEVFIQMVEVLAQRSVCKRAQVGAMIVVEGRLVSVGYNGPPSGYEHCVVCKGENCDIAIHAEVNAIVFAAKEGIRIKGGVLYCSMSPCINCAKMVINSGIVRVVYKEEYRDKTGIEMLRKSNIECSIVDEREVEGPKQTEQMTFL